MIIFGNANHSVVSHFVRVKLFFFFESESVFLVEVAKSIVVSQPFIRSWFSFSHVVLVLN